MRITEVVQRSPLELKTQCFTSVHSYECMGVNTLLSDAAFCQDFQFLKTV